MYQKNTLNIDTLLCIRPILTITADKNKPKTLDTSKSISKIFPQLFKELHFNYINIEDGQILLKKETKDQTSALVQKSNLKIFNLSINAMHTPFLKTDSILFGLKDIEFITPDSAFQIVASELMIINDDLVLKNSFFGPTHFNKTSKNISFSAPEFRLNNINFIDLIQKRLNATQAELFQPTINVHASKSDNKKPDTSETTIKHFYAALHDFRELVGIEKLRIIDGNLSVKNADKQHTTIQMKGINALILPIHFVNSDSLIHIKHSLPKINIAAVSVVSDKLNISVSDFRFDGVNRKNYAAHIHLKMQDEVDIQGNNIYWETFDWDLFQKYKYIDIKEFDAQNLSVKIFSEEIKKNSTGSHIDLPNIRVGKLNIDQLSFQSSIANDTISLNAHHVMIDSLHTIKRFFAWKKLDGLYKNIHIQKENLTANIQLLKFNALTEVVIQHVSINTKERDANLNIKIPAITILGNFYSTDFSRINVQKLNIQNLVIKHSSISSTSKKEASHKAFNIPINIFSKELIVSNAQINYEQIHASDTLLVSGQFNIKMQNMVSSKTDDKIFMFDTFILDVNQLKATKNQSSLEIPTLSMHSKNGSLKNTLNNTIQFDSDLSVHWHGSNFTHTIVKNNSILRLENLSGTFSKNNFIYTSDKAIELQSVLNNMNIDNGSFHFSNHHCVLGVNKIQWKNKLYTLSFSDISYQPKLSLEDANKHATSQFDYLTLTGKSVQLKNINIKGTNKDSAIYIQNILLDQIELTSTRDKNIPKRTAKLKEMPTKIIQSIGWPIAIDSVKVTNSRVIVHQIAEDTYTKATIPINNINATITNVTNRTGAKDSLYLTAHATILNVAINSFNYTESYNDSLSYFHASSNILPGSFTDLNPITVPLASLEIDNGYSNKLNAVWAGNKYAAIGQMNFIYKNLSIHILNKNDTSQTNLALRIESNLANEVIHKSNTKTSVIFFERNAEKQIFNYWLKVTMQGVYSSVGIRNSNKYLKQYARVEEKYRLPKSSGIKK